eukprot:TRINITY_DN2902_c0_g1_i1.p1 TRINITY_DN2902_c0_g1~~TRINITY_DN2902_c0_g1_i1.p1  ORF type:complete len:735 (+),score=223.44 TRINITY_DN2902_c0_g1_i1:213-2207(+)
MDILASPNFGLPFGLCSPDFTLSMAAMPYQPSSYTPQGPQMNLAGAGSFDSLCAKPAPAAPSMLMGSSSAPSSSRLLARASSYDIVKRLGLIYAVDDSAEQLASVLITSQGIRVLNLNTSLVSPTGQTVANGTFLPREFFRDYSLHLHNSYEEQFIINFTTLMEFLNKMLDHRMYEDPSSYPPFHILYHDELLYVSLQDSSRGVQDVELDLLAAASSSGGALPSSSPVTPGSGSDSDVSDPSSPVSYEGHSGPAGRYGFISSDALHVAEPQAKRQRTDIGSMIDQIDYDVLFNTVDAPSAPVPVEALLGTGTDDGTPSSPLMSPSPTPEFVEMPAQEPTTTITDNIPSYDTSSNNSKEARPLTAANSVLVLTPIRFTIPPPMSPFEYSSSAPAVSPSYHNVAPSMGLGASPNALLPAPNISVTTQPIRPPTTYTPTMTISPSSDMEDSRAAEQAASSKKRRLKTTPDQVNFLESIFAQDPSPSKVTRDKISEKLNSISPKSDAVSARQVEVWFQNRRAKDKKTPKMNRSPSSSSSTPVTCSTPLRPTSSYTPNTPSTPIHGGRPALVPSVSYSNPQMSREHAPGANKSLARCPTNPYTKQSLLPLPLSQGRLSAALISASPASPVSPVVPTPGQAPSDSEDSGPLAVGTITPPPPLTFSYHAEY